MNITLDLSTTSIYLGFILNGLFTGLGAAIGTYMAQEHIIQKAKSLLSKIRNGKNGQT